MKKILLILLINFSLFGVDESFNPLEGDNFNLMKDAPFRMPADILQDSEGYFWFATMHGLYRFDGNEFIQFIHDPADSNSISFNDVISIFEDSNRNIWIGTWGGGANKLNPSRDSFQRIKLSESNDEIIWDFAEDNRNNIYIATENSGLFSYKIKTDKAEQVLTADNEINNKLVRSLHFDRREALWVGTDNGLYRLEADSSTLIGIKESSRNPALITEIAEDNDGRIWLSSFSGLYRVENDYLVPVVESNSPVNQYEYSLLSLTIDEDVIWSGSFTGLIKYGMVTKSVNRFIFESESSTDNFIRKLYIDESQNYWSLSRAKGLIIERSSPNQNYSIIGKDIFNGIPLLSVLKYDNNRVLIGTQGSGLFSYSPKENRVVKVQFEENIPMYRGIVNSILKIDDERILVGTESGVRFLNVSGSPTLVEQEFYELFRIRVPVVDLIEDNQNIYIATWGGGVFIFNKSSGALSELELPDNISSRKAGYINDIHISREKLLIGSLAGLIMKTGNEFTLYNSSNHNLSHNYIYSISEDGEGNLWIGTADGLNFFNPEKNTIKIYTEKNGLPSRVISSVVFDNSGNLWVSTSSGIAKFIREEDIFITHPASDLNHSLFNNNSFAIADSLIYFGSTSGLVKLNSASFTSLSNKAAISSLTFFDNDLQRERFLTYDSISVNHQFSILKVTFGNMKFTDETLIPVKYKLEPLQKEWRTLTDRNSVTFENLSPGKYKILAAGGNPEISNTPIYSASFEIYPPFYTAWWFVLIVIIFAVIFIYLIHRIIVKRKLEKVILLEKIKSDEAEKVRRETAADFHDELGNKLTRISLLSRMVIRRFNQQLPDAANLIEQISKNSDELYEGTRDFIWSLKTENDSVYSLLLRLKDFGDEIFENTGIEFVGGEYPSGFKNVRLDMPARRKIAMIFKEGMTNSLKHSSCKEVILKSQLHDEYFEVYLSDDGYGFFPDEEFIGDGLRNMRQRAESLGGELSIESGKDRGTKLKFRMSLRN